MGWTFKKTYTGYRFFNQSNNSGSANFEFFRDGRGVRCITNGATFTIDPKSMFRLGRILMTLGTYEDCSFDDTILLMPKTPIFNDKTLEEYHEHAINEDS